VGARKEGGEREGGGGTARRRSDDGRLPGRRGNLPPAGLVPDFSLRAACVARVPGNAEVPELLRVTQGRPGGPPGLNSVWNSRASVKRDLLIGYGYRRPTAGLISTDAYLYQK